MTSLIARRCLAPQRDESPSQAENAERDEVHRLLPDHRAPVPGIGARWGDMGLG